MLHSERSCHNRHHAKCEGTYPSIVPYLLALHALTGADTSAATFGIGKIKALKDARNAGLPLHAIGDTQADEAIVLEQAMSFILACHGKGFSSMSEARIKMWRKKTDIGSALKLCSLPPTTEAFTENAKRAHLQATQWRASIEGTVPLIDALTHGWEHDGSYLKPTALPEGTLSALVAILEMIRCRCASGYSMLQ